MANNTKSTLLYTHLGFAYIPCTLCGRGPAQLARGTTYKQARAWATMVDAQASRSRCAFIAAFLAE